MRLSVGGTDETMRTGRRHRCVAEQDHVRARQFELWHCCGPVVTGNPYVVELFLFTKITFWHT